jgi:hypothetical protein
LDKKTALIIIALALISVLITVVVYAAVTSVNISGHINSPASVQPSPSSISLGSVTQGETVTPQVVLTNIGEVTTPAITVDLSQCTIGTLTSNLAPGQTLAPGASVTITFTLTIAADAPAGDFSFNVIFSY